MGDLSNARGGSPATSASRSSSRRSEIAGSAHPRPLSSVSAASRCGVPDVIFVNPPDPAHMCPVCDRAMRYPVKLGDCGHRCCSGCLMELVRSVTAETMFLDRIAEIASYNGLLLQLHTV